jgi:hypothetical protein
MDPITQARVVIGAVVLLLAIALAVVGGILFGLVAAKRMSPQVAMGIIRLTAFTIGDVGGSVIGIIALMIMYPSFGNYLVNTVMTNASVQQAQLQQWITSFFDADSVVPTIIGAFFQRQQIAYILICVAIGKICEYFVRFIMGHRYHKRKAMR